MKGMLISVASQLHSQDSDCCTVFGVIMLHHGVSRCVMAGTSVVLAVWLGGAVATLHHANIVPCQDRKCRGGR